MNPLRAFDGFKSQASQRVVDAWFVASLFGFALAAASYYVGVGIVHFDGRLLNGHTVAGFGVAKEVGYFAALNWSVCGALMVPGLVVCSLKMHAAMEQTLRTLADRSMVRTKDDFKIVTADQLVARWKHDRALGLLVPFLAGAAAFSFIMLGWLTEVAIPSMHGISSQDMLSIGSNAEEFDWSISCLMNNGQHVMGGCTGSMIFSLVAYLFIPAFNTAYAFSCMIDATRFVAFACGETRSPELADSDGALLPTGWVLVASPAQADDPRCGFSAFAPFVTPFLGMVMFILLTLFLVITQNTYLRDPNSHDILDFFSQDFFGVISAVAGLQDGHMNLAAAIAQLLRSDKAVSLFNPKTLFSLFTYFFVVILCVSASVALIRRAAAGGRELAIEHISELAAETGQNRDNLRARLDSMTFWPLAWITQRATVLVIVFMSLALLSFRLALFPTAIGVGLLVAALWQRQRSRTDAAKHQRPGAATPIALAHSASPMSQRVRSGVRVNLLISYRRSDSDAIAGRIRDNIAMHFGESSVFMDIDSVPFGTDFRESINAALGRTDMVLAIIGKNWLGTGKDGRPRVWEEGDPVRFEIESTLKLSIPVIPILVQGATMPAADELPPSLRDFSFRNAVTVDSGRDFHPHLDRLIRSMEHSLEGRAGPAPTT
jgi:hypothetical protein